MAGSKPVGRREYFERMIDKFWSCVDRKGPDDCWLWVGIHRPPTHCGMVYGQLSFTDDGKTINYRAHRFAWMLANGRIPEGLHICHSCDTPLCVNPAHLWAGTNRQNVRDRDRKGRVQRGEGHYMSKLTADQVREIKASDESTKELADRFGVHYTTILKVRIGERWTHVN